MTGPDLAAIRGARHPVRLTLVERYLEHRVRSRRSNINLRPAVAALAAVQQYAKITDEAGARSNPQMTRIAGDLADVAAVDLSFDVKRLQRHVTPMVATIRAAEDAGASNSEHRIGPPATGEDAVHVDHVVVDVLAVAQIFPVLAAVGRADRAADFDRPVKAIGLAGAAVEHQDALGRIGVGRGRDVREAHADRQTRPTLAGIVAAIDLAILAPDQDHIGVMRM